MQTTLRMEMTVLPGHRLEISNPEFLDGALFMSNDVGFRSVPGLPLAILDDLLRP